MSQINSVSQLSDVQPTIGHFKLDLLVERCGVSHGYLRRCFRKSGAGSLLRLVLNTALNPDQQIGAASQADLVRKKTVQAYKQDFASNCHVGRVDALEANG